jgi:hypothetical protein
MPSLADLLEIVGAIGLLAGASIGFFLPASGGRQIAENVALGGALGGIVGTFIAFALYAGIVIAGGS